MRIKLSLSSSFCCGYWLRAQFKRRARGEKKILEKEKTTKRKITPIIIVIVMNFGSTMEWK